MNRKQLTNTFMCFLIWGDWLSCDPLRGSHDSQLYGVIGYDVNLLRGSHDSQSPHIWKLLFIPYKG